MHATGHLTPRSALRYRPLSVDLPEITPWIKRASRALTRPLVPPQPQSVAHSTLTKSRLSWETVVGLSMVMTLLLIVFSHVLVDWTTTLYDTAVYGTPRTFQVDVSVGHEGATDKKSHFIAQNDRGQVLVIEFPGNDAEHVRIYLGPLLTGPHADQVPVTLTFPDPKHTGTPNMLVQVQGMSLLFLNQHGTFVPANNVNAVDGVASR
jgi:hypothetical protein